MAQLNDGKFYIKSKTSLMVFTGVAKFITAFVVMFGVVAFFYEPVRTIVSVFTSSRLGAVGYVYYATCYTGRTYHQNGSTITLARKSDIQRHEAKQSSDLEYRKSIFLSYEKDSNCINRKFIDYWKVNDKNIHPYYRLNLSKDGQFYLLAEGVEGHFDDVKWGDILQANSDVRLVELLASKNDHEYCTNGKYGTKYHKCGRNLIKVKANSCVIAIGKEGFLGSLWPNTGGRYPIHSEKLTFDYSGGWLRVATTSCNIFN